jgi:hypothetical protein
MIEAAYPGEFDVRRREHLWASCHPLADPLQADQMTTEYATSPDGLAWTWHAARSYR